ETAAEHARRFGEHARQSPFKGGTRVAVPLVLRGRALGSINLGFETWRPVEPDDRELLGSVAIVAAQALERTRLFESERRAREQGELIYRLSDAANRALALEEIYEPALEAVCAGLKVERASILIHDAARVMRFRAWRGLSESYRKAVD